MNESIYSKILAFSFICSSESDRHFEFYEHTHSKLLKSKSICHLFLNLTCAPLFNHDTFTSWESFLCIERWFSGNHELHTRQFIVLWCPLYKISILFKRIIWCNGSNYYLMALYSLFIKYQWGIIVIFYYPLDRYKVSAFLDCKIISRPILQLSMKSY